MTAGPGVSPPAKNSATSATQVAGFTREMMRENARASRGIFGDLVPLFFRPVAELAPYARRATGNRAALRPRLAADVQNGDVATAVVCSVASV
jgi:hypothetical protein